MTITLKFSEFEELWGESEARADFNSGLEMPIRVPDALGQGSVRKIELDAEFSLEIWDIQGCDDVRVMLPDSQHLVGFGILRTGSVTSDINGGWNRHKTIISGGGMQRKMTVEYHQLRPIIGINIYLSPKRLAMLFSGADGQITPELQFLTKGNDWQSLLYLPQTSSIANVVQQINCCPYRGMTKRLYLQAKALEIISIQLSAVVDRASPSAVLPQFKSQTISKLHHAQEIMRSQLDNPPTQSELAQQLDISERTLRRGFRSLFGTTIFGYLTEQRLKQAEVLLRNSDRSISDIANQVGYAHLGYFARAFKRKYGMNPSDCR